MKRLQLAGILFLLTFSITVTSCKKELVKSDKSRPKINSLAFSMEDAGDIHNLMLEYYYNQLDNNPAFFNGLTQATWQTQLRNELFSMSDNYVSANELFLGVNHEDYEDFMEYLTLNNIDLLALPTNLSTDFEDYMAAAHNIINTYSDNKATYEYEFTQLKTGYENILTNEAELMALETSYQVALSSRTYWDANIEDWDILFTEPGSVDIPNGRASYEDILWADFTTGVSGTIKGATYGITLGPGGGVAGGMLGLLGGAAAGSATAYGSSVLMDWVFSW